LKRIILVFSFTAASLCAVPISVLYYDTPNGTLGGLPYLDEFYACQGIVACTPQGNNLLSGAPLTGGLGDLTDGVIANQNWDINATPYIGWADTNPLIEFHFAPTHVINTVTISFDDSDGQGGVSLPLSVTFGNGINTLNIVVDEAPGSAPVSISFDVASLGATDYLSVMPNRKISWTFISEVAFDGDPTPVPEPDSATLFATAFLATLAAGAIRRHKFFGPDRSPYLRSAIGPAP
jgi:hypothetical protein